MAGALAAVPGFSAVLKMPAAGSSTLPAGTFAAGEPLIAHVRDVQTGEIALLVGTDQVIHRDAELAARLYNAARRGR